MKSVHCPRAYYVLHYLKNSTGIFFSLQTAYFFLLIIPSVKTVSKATPPITA